MLKVKGYSDLVRDPKTNAIINTNCDEYDKYKQQREKVELRRMRDEETDRKIEQLNQSIDEIKMLINRVLEK
jgi:hypothetical protein